MRRTMHMRCQLEVEATGERPSSPFPTDCPPVVWGGRQRDLSSGFGTLIGADQGTIWPLLGAQIDQQR
jgi:hypothetical protein